MTVHQYCLRGPRNPKTISKTNYLLKLVRRAIRNFCCFIFGKQSTSRSDAQLHATIRKPESNFDHNISAFMMLPLLYTRKRAKRDSNLFSRCYSVKTRPGWLLKSSSGSKYKNIGFDWLSVSFHFLLFSQWLDSNSISFLFRFMFSHSNSTEWKYYFLLLSRLASYIQVYLMSL